METEKERAVRKILWIVGLTLVAQAIASAQGVPRVEVFGGYSYLRIRGYAADESLLFPGAGTVAFPSFGSNGWTGSVAVHATRWLSAVADVSGLYAEPTRTIGGAPITIGTREHNYLFGPRFSSQYGRWMLFTDALFGEAHARVLIGAPEVLTPIGVVETKFAMAAGMGVDLTVYSRQHHLRGAGQKLDIRLLQADWLRTNFVGSRQDNIRISTGIVFRF
jgi:hypothetical protein